jgi:hypothetical protein
MRAPNRKRLSAFLLQSLKPGAVPYLVWDTYQRGLVVQVSPKGHLSWYVIYGLSI